MTDQTANTAQRVDVERFYPWVEHTYNGGVSAEMVTAPDGGYVTFNAYAALLQQVAAQAAEIERERSRREHTQQWYAERLAKIEEISKREGLWNEVAAVIANGSGTRQLPDGTYFYDPPTYAQQLNTAKHRAEAAERAREEANVRTQDARDRLEMACGLLQEVQPLTNVAPRFHYTRDRIASFLAANWGDKP